MAQWSRAQTTLTEDPGSIPSIHMAVDKFLTLVLGNDAIFWSLWAPHTCGVHIYMQAEHPYIVFLRIVI